MCNNERSGCEMSAWLFVTNEDRIMNRNSKDEGYISQLLSGEIEQDKSRNNESE